MSMLRIIRAIHTLIWAVMASAIFYLLYVGITGTMSQFLWMAIGLILVESVTLLINRWRCPLTTIASRYTAVQPDNFDIYLPRWLAKYNKLIFTIILGVALLLLLARATSVGWR